MSSLTSYFKYRRTSTILFVLALLVVSPRFFASWPDSHSIDSGWAWALYFFSEHGNTYQWGTDIIYTFGPLGVFYTRVFPHSWWLYQLLFDAYTVLNIVLAFTVVRRMSENRTTVYLFILALAAAAWEINFLLQLCSLYFLIATYRRNTATILPILIALNSGLLLYNKLNTVAFTVVLIPALLAVLLLQKKYWAALLSLLCFILVNAVLLSIFNISWKGYFGTSLDTIQYFTYAMYFSLPAYNKAIYASLIFPVGVIIALAFTSFIGLLQRHWQKIIVSACIFVLFYILFKQGYTRFDSGHFSQYFNYLPLLLCAIIFFEPSFLKPGKFVVLAACAGSVMITALIYVRWQKFYTGLDKPPVVHYVKGLIDFVQTPARQYPITEGKSADYFSNNCISMMNGQQYNWHNRPAFQSIAVVSAKIDSINTAFYNSPKAPDSLFLNNSTVDDRNPLWDEPQLQWTIFTRYRYVYTDTAGQCVMAKRDAALTYTKTLLLDTAIAINEMIILPAQNNIVLQAHVEYNWKGKLAATLYKPASIQVIQQGIKEGNTASRYIPALHNNQLLVIDRYDSSGHHSAYNDFVQNRFNYKPNVRRFYFACTMPGMITGKIQLKLYRINCAGN
ncbi:MAG TPA: hypothetical protein PKC39_00955 [Ferruginibacter sp.]|nr:hypothetical protein [Ferruginibacter sp.]HMP19501.1 hypothetical protein [Ferruginibacter sp.]